MLALAPAAMRGSGSHLASLATALVAAAYVLVLRGVARTPAGLLLGSGLVLACFALANKQSFLNQWLLAAQLVVAGLTLAAAAHRPVRDVPLSA